MGVLLKLCCILWSPPLFRIRFLCLSVQDAQNSDEWLPLANMQDQMVYLSAQSLSSLDKAVISFLLQPDLPFKLNLILLHKFSLKCFSSFWQQGLASSHLSISGRKEERGPSPKPVTPLGSSRGASPREQAEHSCVWATGSSTRSLYYGRSRNGKLPYTSRLSPCDIPTHRSPKAP